MPCYTPEPTRREMNEWHELSAIRIVRESLPYYKTYKGPEAVRILCDWCKNHTPLEIKKINAQYWYEDHKKYDLRQSGLAKLTKEEVRALGLDDQR